MAQFKNTNAQSPVYGVQLDVQAGDGRVYVMARNNAGAVAEAMRQVGLNVVAAAESRTAGMVVVQTVDGGQSVFQQLQTLFPADRFVEDVAQQEKKGFDLMKLRGWLGTTGQAFRIWGSLVRGGMDNQAAKGELISAVPSLTSNLIYAGLGSQVKWDDRAYDAATARINQLFGLDDEAVRIISGQIQLAEQDRRDNENVLESAARFMRENSVKVAAGIKLPAKALAAKEEYQAKIEDPRGKPTEDVIAPTLATLGKLINIAGEDVRTLRKPPALAGEFVDRAFEKEVKLGPLQRFARTFSPMKFYRTAREIGFIGMIRQEAMAVSSALEITNFALRAKASVFTDEQMEEKRAKHAEAKANEHRLPALIEAGEEEEAKKIKSNLYDPDKGKVNVGRYHFDWRKMVGAVLIEIGLFAKAMAPQTKRYLDVEKVLDYVALAAVQSGTVDIEAAVAQIELELSLQREAKNVNIATLHTALAGRIEMLGGIPPRQVAVRVTDGPVIAKGLDESMHGPDHSVVRPAFDVPVAQSAAATRSGEPRSVLQPDFTDPDVHLRHERSTEIAANYQQQKVPA